MRAAVYIRMSTDQQENSPERQRSQILPYCSRKGYDVVGRYEDLGMRGTDDSRPQFQKLLRDAKEGLFDVVVVDEQSRLTRSDPVEFISTVIGPLRSAGVVLDTVAKGIVDWNDLGQFLVGSIAQHTANSEVVTLSRRVVTELARKAQKADLVSGKPPYGYTQIWKNAAGEVVHRGNRNWNRRPEGWHPTLEPKEKEAEVVRWIFDTYLNSDLSLCEITKRLHDLGHPSPTGKALWQRCVIRDILRNQTYVGDFVYNRVTAANFHKLTFSEGGGVAVPKKPVRGGKRVKVTKNREEDWVVIKDAHPAIITREQFTKSKASLEKNRKRCSPLKSKNEYALSYLLKCAACGSWMIGAKDREKKVYICGGFAAFGSKKCNLYRIREETAIALLERELAEGYLAEYRLAELREQAKRLKEKKKSGDETVRLKKVVAELDAKITKAKQNILLLDSDLVKGAQEQIRAWEKERQAVKEQIATLERTDPVEDVESRIAAMEAGLEKIRQAKVTVREKPAKFRSVVRECFEWVELRYRSEERTVRLRHFLVGGIVRYRTDEVVEFQVAKRLQGS